MRSNIFAAVLLAIGAAAALPAQAGWYGGFSLGESRTSRELVANRESTITLATEFNTEFSGRDLAYKAMVGYEVFPWLAIELDYADLGSHSLKTRFLGGDPPQPAGIFLEREVRGFGLDAVFSLPIAPQWRGFARVGAMRVELEARQALEGNVVFTNGDPLERSRSTKQDETVLRYGLGMQWSLDTCHLLRLEWQRQEKIGKAFAVGGSGTTGEADTDAIFVGYVYRFGF